MVKYDGILEIIVAVCLKMRIKPFMVRNGDYIKSEKSKTQRTNREFKCWYRTIKDFTCRREWNPIP